MTENTKTTSRPGKRTIIFNALVLLSIGGITIMNFSVDYGLYYWLGMAVVFGIASVVMAWHSDTSKESRGHQVQRQALHWASLVVSILLLFLLQNTESLTPTTGGLIALLMLGLTTVLAGVHFEWRLAVLGAALMLTFVAAVVTEKFFWVVLILMVVLMVVIPQVKRKHRQS